MTPAWAAAPSGPEPVPAVSGPARTSPAPTGTATVPVTTPPPAAGTTPPGRTPGPPSATPRELDALPAEEPVAAPGGHADLGVTATVRPVRAAGEDPAERPAAGASARLAPETYDYLLTVTNHGPSTARGVRITDRLPEALEFVSSRDGCTAAGRTVRCGPLPSLAVRATHTWVITVRLAAGYTGEGEDITNEAEVGSDTVDPEARNDKTSLTGLVIPPSARVADLSLHKTALLPEGRRSLRPGEKFTYLITVRNAGPATARQLSVTDRLPEPLSFVSSPQDCAPVPGSDREVVCPALDRLPTGATAEFRITVRVAEGDRATPSRTTCTPVDNIARVTSASHDPDLSDNANRPGTTGPGGGRLCLGRADGKGEEEDGGHHGGKEEHGGHSGGSGHGRGDLAESGAGIPGWAPWAAGSLVASGAGLLLAARARNRARAER
ncbi:hypothetical protein [Streptomyces sp. NPDC097619]|uniref:DUF11 domain-containing protein n=1 Tax=Streptomyces sp. NPDC097619 TaxID=3157228 RepID=UPI0033313169